MARKNQITLALLAGDIYNVFLVAIKISGGLKYGGSFQTSPNFTHYFTHTYNKNSGHKYGGIFQNWPNKDRF